MPPVAAALPQEGFRDLSRRLRIARLRIARLRVRHAIFQAETELGLLGSEQADFFDERIGAEVKKVRDFENAQAALLNASAELAERKTALDEELAREKALHDEAQAALAAERQPLAGQFEQAESAHRLKLEACARFDRALLEIIQLERQLAERSIDFMKVANPAEQVRNEARAVSDHLMRLPGERKLLLADKAGASQEAGRLEPEVARLRAELQRIDAAASGARHRLAAASRRLTAELRHLDRERKKSSSHMSRLDREKRSPYRLIGACLADSGIAPLNQPQVLEKVLVLRERDTRLSEVLADLQAACAASDAGVLIAFYLLLVALLFALFALASHFLRY
jgi:chromosome segregation ATPase